MAVTSTYTRNVIKSEFQANSFETGNQLAPDVTGLSNGGFAVAYNNGNINDGEVLVDFYDAAHARVGNFKIPHDGDTSAVGQPQVTQLENGNVLVSWIDTGAGDAGLKGRLFDASGTPIGDQITFAPGSGYTDLQISALENGAFDITYRISGHVYQGRFNEAGYGVDGGFFQVDSPALGGDVIQSAVAGLSDGGYVVTYTDPDGDDHTLHARIYNADGTTRVSNVTLDTVGDNTDAKVVGLQGGKWAVVYSDNGWGGDDAGNSAITLRILDANGGNQTPGTYIRVNTPSSQAEAEPDVTVLENGFIVVSWRKNMGLIDNDILARVFTPEGVAVTDEFTVNISGDSDTKSAISGLLSGKFVTTWQDNTLDGSVDGRISAAVSEIVRTTTGDGAADTFTGDVLRDVIDGAGNGDFLDGAGGDDLIDGGIGNDQLVGSEGADVLIGGEGSDILEGGSGLDTASYAGATAGVAASLANPAINSGDAAGDSYLSVENLIGSGHDDVLNGDNSVNGIRGDAGSDTLKGYGGNDRLYGQDNDDTLIGGVGGDLLNGGSGSDTASYLGATAAVGVSLSNPAINKGDAVGDSYVSIENIFGSSFDDTLNGNSAGNVINGAAGGDVIKGYAGNDTLTGGSGGDNFIFNTALNAATNLDTITDFNAAADTIQVEDTIFTKLAATGPLLSGYFRANATGTAQDANDHIVYETDTGKLFYDADGNGAGAAIQFALITGNPAITAADFVVI